MRHRGELRDPVLIVDANPEARSAMARYLRADGQESYLVGTGAEGLAALRQIQPVLAVVNVALPDLAGKAIEAFRHHGDVPVIAVAAAPHVREAIAVIRQGAVDYVGLRDRRGLLDAVRRAREESTDRSALRNAERAVRDRYGFKHLVSQSPRMLDVFDKVQAVAGTDATVLIRGETGTGKELISRAIHDRSKRRDGPIISVNCGAFSESLLESELFGHERGSFTGAVGRREGLFEMADRGTLFLDELGETSLNVQVNLLRVLEEFRFRRVGGRDLVDVDVRIVAATNVNLESAVADGRFREDLYYRLNVFPITLPPLRERREDIPLLLRHFIDAIARDYEVDPPTIAAEALQAILDYRWPGNVRQLRALCERWVITFPGARVEVHHLPLHISERRAGPTPGVITIDDQATLKENTHTMVEQLERAYLYRLLRRCGGHLARTADAAGITRRTLYTKMKHHGLNATDFRADGAPDAS